MDALLGSAADSAMPAWTRTVLLLLVSNVFMTYAWYGHLKDLRDKPLLIAIAASWGVAFLEYCFQVPANRLGYGELTLGQLKVIQEVISMVVFMAFAVFYFRRPLTTDLVWATVCLCAAAYFVFRNGLPDPARSR